jgi:4-diphosphocytidyl-2-C-methyl-D-erythritol kinase
MITFPNAKINLGLHITEKRSDGFHNIESVFYPIGLSDVLELKPAEGKSGVRFSSSGISIPGDTASNLCVKAYELIRRDYPMPEITVHLLKNIPVGAGLGGGSSDAAFFIRLLNDSLDLGLAWGEMHHYAKQLGSDCSFFLGNRPAMVTGRGDEMESLNFSLKGFHLLLVCPPIHISTAEAYALVKPGKSAINLEETIITEPPSSWKNRVVNDFEKSIFPKYAEIEAIKKKIYDLGAVYASMTGSGAAVYGLFEKQVRTENEFGNSFVWQGLLEK